jgi:hypothetical protein
VQEMSHSSREVTSELLSENALFGALTSDLSSRPADFDSQQGCNCVSQLTK